MLVIPVVIISLNSDSCCIDLCGAYLFFLFNLIVRLSCQSWLYGLQSYARALNSEIHCMNIFIHQENPVATKKERKQTNVIK